MNWLYVGMGVAVVVLGAGIRIVRPTHKLLIETLGKYSKTGEQGLNWIIPIIQSSRYVNITEQMVDVPEQTVQTSDKLNTLVDAMVYYQVVDAKASEYNVDNHRRQLTSLARTTLRAVMGNMTLTECIQSRDRINSEVEKVLDKETDSYGVSVLRVEVQRIEPPQDVQSAMNNVVKAEQKKIAAKDIAEALETEADGMRRAEIKKAEGRKQASILEAEGKSKAFDLIDKSFKGNAQKLKNLEVTENSLRNNSKVILTDKGITPQLLIGELPTSNKK
jgi:regulator of protease activity HflC (stomatin/prohibitin superfamily)